MKEGFALNTDWGLIIGITFTGLTVVFLALLVLILCMKVMGIIMSCVQNKKHLKEEGRKPMSKELSLQKQGQDFDVPPEIVAVIAAAIAAEHPNEYPVAIHPVTASNDATTSAWKQAGILQNTQAFMKGVAL